MSTLTLDRPSLSRVAASMFDAVLLVPSRIAHAREMQAEVQRVLDLSEAELAEMGTDRDTLLRDIAQRA